MSEEKRLRYALIEHAAFLARELQSDDITEAQEGRLYRLVQRMKHDAKPKPDNEQGE